MQIADRFAAWKLVIGVDNHVFLQALQLQKTGFAAKSQVGEREKLMRSVECLTRTRVRIIFIGSNGKTCFIYDDIVSVLKEYIFVDIAGVSKIF
jgi:ribosome biogenesis protein Nip4